MGRSQRSRLQGEPPASQSAPPSTSGATTAVALLVWGGIIFLAHVWGERLVHRVPRTYIFAAPLIGHVRPHPHVGLIVPVVVGAVLLFLFPRMLRLGWRRLLIITFVAAATWAVSVALADGLKELTRPVLLPDDYLADVSLVGSPGVFLSHFVARIGLYHQHVRAHPPGMVLLLWAMSRVGLRGAGWEAALEILGGAAMTPAALISLREVAGERMARSAAPFVAFAPAVVWIATTGDAFFGGVIAWSIALLIVAIYRSDIRADVMAVGGGILFGGALFLTYGATALLVIPLIVAARQRRLRPLLLAVVGVAVVVLAFAAAGFWWFAGLHASLVQYRASIARFRPQSYFWFGNLGAFAIALGPATAVGLARLRDRKTWLLVAGGLLAVGLADASGLSKAEVERIWLPFTPWILLAASALVPWHADDSGWLDDHPIASMRRWLLVTLAAGIVLQVVLKWTW